MQKKLIKHLERIYQGENLEFAKDLFLKELSDLQPITGIKKPDEKTTYLITYGDSFYSGEEKPLSVLNRVIVESLPYITDVHILPMFPYTSDDGFSVVDYQKINPELGDWENIQQLSKTRRLMFDFVCNHMSKSSEWFQKFLEEDEDFKKAFIEFDSSFDSSMTTRPRVSPLFHSYISKSGNEKRVWTTFSEDQVDTNVSDPKMLLRLTKVLLDYVNKGASSIRLDAIGFMWKESGTTSMHLEQTHEIIKLWRTLINYIAPNMQIITETNVPHKENISYFGDGYDEANMVYQFPLPPLTLYTLISGNSKKISNWAKTIGNVSNQATYFNFLASHDGIGLRPTEGILEDSERQIIIDKIIESGGRASYKKNPDGSQSVYELNASYASVLETTEKMLAAHAILLSFIGVPAIYYHSIFGSKNDVEGMIESGINRRINRKKLEINTLFSELENDSFRDTIYNGITEMLALRKNYSAFNPYGNQNILDFGEKIVAIEREYEGQKVIALINISNETVKCNQSGFDVITNNEFNQELNPYQYAWITV
ncbi:alpha-amylase family glycosyl hydrolase [Streptococcus parauberis]|uniref:Sucrose phosphorylase n=1 Tax=Streptococcus parauberis TaxID=1348 RepID=A0A854WAL9_9STRE|nr:alpha-amylase family glycosyl hydrolase [Streptococcus parauberis]PCH13718.1 Sucrose phosphorylase [Streptococcus parauberis]PIO79409.1 Sucrose phosphorylase [Streptococcus parauberis]POS67537.1 Sucrose phosphorylase [Streptococcus parauberis]